MDRDTHGLAWLGIEHELLLLQSLECKLHGGLLCMFDLVEAQGDLLNSITATAFVATDNLKKTTLRAAAAAAAAEKISGTAVPSLAAGLGDLYA